MWNGKAFPVRVLVADHHRVIRVGMRALLAASGIGLRFEVGEAVTGEDAIEQVAAGGIDVALVEFGLPGRGGPKAVEVMRSRRPGCPVLGMSMQEDRKYAERMMAAGARGFIGKNIEPDVLAVAIRTVLHGKVYYSNEVALKLLEPVTLPRVVPLDRLTRMELEVFKAILLGLIDREIADRMGIGKRTVDKHRQRIKLKVGARNTVELVQAGFRLGLLVQGRVAP